MRAVGENSWRDPNKIVNRFHSLAQCVWQYPRNRLHFIPVVLYVKCFAGGVCRCVLTWVGEAAEALEVHRKYFSPSPLHLFWLAVTSICLPPSLLLALKWHSSLFIPENSWTSQLLLERNFWVDALKPVNANKSSETTLWLLASGEGPSPRFWSAGVLPCTLFLQGNCGAVFSEIIPAPH